MSGVYAIVNTVNVSASHKERRRLLKEKACQQN